MNIDKNGNTLCSCGHNMFIHPLMTTSIRNNGDDKFVYMCPNCHTTDIVGKDVCQRAYILSFIRNINVSLEQSVNCGLCEGVFGEGNCISRLYDVCMIKKEVEIYVQFTQKG